MKAQVSALQEAGKPMYNLVEKIEREFEELGKQFATGSRSLAATNNESYGLLIQYQKARDQFKRSSFCKVVKRECKQRIGDAYENLRNTMDAKLEEEVA